MSAASIDRKDYSLVGEETRRAAARGLASADWYAHPIPRKRMKELMRRKDGPAVRDTAIWLGVMIVCAGFGIHFWGSWLAVPFFIVYGVFYGSASDSRWHECGHGTAFKTAWMNDVVYNIACFMIMREPTVWRWSHTRHHTDTIIVGRDPEISVKRPPDITGILLNLFALKSTYFAMKKLALHATGQLTDEEKTFIPEMEQRKVYVIARIYIAILLGVTVLSVALHSWIPAMLVGLPTLYGGYLTVIYGVTQHAGLSEDVLDHRLNSRTVYMNPISRFIYWNMNYHVEHHMFPMVPYHALPALHEAIKAECPEPYPSIIAAYAEIIPALLKQRRDPHYFVLRQLPGRQACRNPLASPNRPNQNQKDDGKTIMAQWINACAEDEIDEEDVIRFDHAGQSFAVYRLEDEQFCATSGFCTHENVHLADGLVMGRIIECPKHNGRFDIPTGKAKGAPACIDLKTFPVKIEDGRVFIDLG